MHKLSELLNVIHESVELSSADEIKEAVKMIIEAQNLSGAAANTLKALFEHGPLYDEDIPSKMARDDLVSCGLASKIIIRGAWGYNACTYQGAHVCKLMMAMRGAL